MSVSALRLLNGKFMPIFGLGTWQSKVGEVGNAVRVAIDAGYRHIDTAQNYFNEHEIGEAIEDKIKEGVLKREDLFLVTKLAMAAMAPADVRPMTELSLKKLRTNYIDLYLIHFPVAFSNEGLKDGVLWPKDENGMFKTAIVDPLDTWKEMEKLVDDGLVKAIGLSNFTVDQIQRIWDNSRIKPANVQVELHVYFQQKQLVEFCTAKGITVVAYAPLGSPSRPMMPAVTAPVMDDPLIVQLAQKYNKQPAHILLRYLMQLGIAVIPKSVQPDRVRSNFQVWDFELSADDMASVRALDKNFRTFKMNFGPSVTEHPHFPKTDN